MTFLVATTRPFSRLRERAGVRAGAEGAAALHSRACLARHAREPLTPNLLPQGPKG